MKEKNKGDGSSADASSLPPSGEGERATAMSWPPMAFFLTEEMEIRGWNTAVVASRFRTLERYERNVILLDLVLAVQEDSMILDDDLFEDLGHAFGVSGQYFKRLHEIWLDAPAESREPFEAGDHLFSCTIPTQH